ncbi:MAG: ATP-grasp fold amidoligase family protein [Myxococcales bacterium]|jgi:hypothetical protein|nr:ATP-grasp fold amidoligase family protein [Myxococcales bacterium]
MSFTEKIKWRSRHPIRNSWHFVDKIEAKSIAKQRAPECKIARVIETYDFSSSSYVVKANHGSGWCIRVKDGKEINTGKTVITDMLEKQAGLWLNKTYNRGRERQYVPIKPRVFFEEYIDDFLECRCFCFHGKLRFIMVDVDHSGEVRSTLYDVGWNRIRARWRDPEGFGMQRPSNLNKMISIVEQLAADMDFIRVDVYLKGPDVYFGEFTFTPNAGRGTIQPQRLDNIWGSYWKYDMSDSQGLRIPAGVEKLNVTSRFLTKMHKTAHMFAKDLRGILRHN